MKTFNSVAQMKLAFLTAGQMVATSGYYAPGDGGGAGYLIEASQAVDGFANHDLAGTTVAILQIADFINVKQFGAKGDGIIDDADSFNAATTVIELAGGSLIVPPAEYLLSSQWIIEATSQLGEGRTSVWGYGATLTTTGAISALEVNTSGVANGGVTVYGLKANHRANANATWGFNTVGSWNTKYVDCTVEAHGTAVGYAAFRVADNASAAGSFWTTYDNCWVRKRSGGDVGEIPVGVLIQGNSNATTVNGGGLNNCDKAIKIFDQGDIDTPNAVLIFNVKIEACTDGIYVDADTASAVSVGLRITNNRCEDTTSFFNYQLDTESSDAPELSGNMLISSVTNHVVNPNNLRIYSSDNSTTPRINPLLGTSGPHTFAVGDVSEQGIILQQGVGAESGFKFELVDGTDLMKAGYIASGIFEYAANVGGGVKAYYSGIGGLSGTAIRSKNYAGRATFAAATSVAVVFNTEETDADYEIEFSNPANQVLWHTSKTTTGFTANSSVSNSTTIGWKLIRP